MANYDDKNKEELLDEARARGLEGYSQLNKPELQALLEKDDASNVEGNENVDSEVQKEYQEEYVPERREEVEKAAEEGYDLNELKPEASDPDNPVVEARLADDEVYQELTDEEKEQSDLALDASGPLNLESPYGRVMTGAQSEEQAKEQEEQRSKLPDEFVGDITEHVSERQAKSAERALDPEKQAEHEAEAYDALYEDQPQNLSEHYKNLEERRDRLHERDLNVLKLSDDAEKRAVHETQGHEGQPVDYTKVFQQRAQVDTTGLGGPGAGTLERAFRVPTLRSGIYHQAFNTERPRDAEIVQAEEERQEAVSSDE